MLFIINTTKICQCGLPNIGSRLLLSNFEEISVLISQMGRRKEGSVTQHFADTFKNQILKFLLTIWIV